jgi:hypothetical protein
MLITELATLRLRDDAILVRAVESGVAQLTWAEETFAYAEGWDERAATAVSWPVSRPASSSTARASWSSPKRRCASSRRTGARSSRAQAAQQGQAGGVTYTPGAAQGAPIKDGGTPYTAGASGGTTADPPTPPRLRRYHGTAELDTMRVARDAGRIAEEIIQHLSTLPSASVRLEIEADIPDGVPDNVVRTVYENGRTLRFTSQGFEEE